MSEPTDTRTREREALKTALTALNNVVANCVIRDPLRAAKNMDVSIAEARVAILAYGRAVREAGWDAVDRLALDSDRYRDDLSGLIAAREHYNMAIVDAKRAIEALEEKEDAS